MSKLFYLPIISIAMFLLLFSCGNSLKSKNSKEINSVCSSSDCDDIYNWKITLQGRSFPDKSKILINDEIVLNECFTKQKYSISRNSNPEFVYLDHFTRPVEGKMVIKIYDLGVDCSEENEFLFYYKVSFNEVKTSLGNEIVIDL